MFARANDNENMLRTNGFVRMEKLCVLTSLIFGKLGCLIIHDMLFIKKMKPSSTRIAERRFLTGLQRGYFFLRGGGGYTHSGYHKTLSATIACNRISRETET